METKRNPLARLGGWAGRHKKLVILLVLLLAAAVLAVRIFMGRGRAAAAAAGYSFVRTTTLEKTTLSDSVSVTGTVQSGEEASVTVADGAKTYKVATVNVEVGDVVKKGDVIATLDTADLEKQIESAEESYSDSLQSAQTSYDRAVDDYNVSAVQHENTLIDLQADIDDADETLSEAQETLEDAKDAKDSAESALSAARSRYSAVSAKASEAAAQLQPYNDALAQAAQKQAEALAAKNADPDPEGEPAKAYDEATTAYKEAEATLTKAKEGVSLVDSSLGLNLYGYDAVEQALAEAQSAVSSAEQALTQAESAVTSAETAVEQAESQVKNAHDQYDNEKNYSTLKSKSQQVEDAATKLEQSSRTSDTLEDLQATLDDCTLTATMDGTVTALNATVGSVCSGTVATIQNTGALTVDVTIPASSVTDVATGMACRITSDATGSTEIAGTLTRIDPVANDQGSFGATVTVDQADAGLLIGIQAKVEIVISEKNDVFTVPIDAVGTAEDGSSYVLRRTGGEGVDMTFEEVTVTTGDANDFYIEITGGDLAEGDVIRSSADLTEGIETAGSDDAMMMGGGMGGGQVVVTTNDGGQGGGPGGQGGGPAGGGPGGM